MPLTKNNTNNPIRGIVKKISATQRSACQDIIAKLDFADLSRSACTLHSQNGVRLDMQGTTTNGARNLQVQIGNETAATALIADSVLETTDPANQRGATHGAISALNQSLDTGTVWELNGTLP